MKKFILSFLGLIVLLGHVQFDSNSNSSLGSAQIARAETLNDDFYSAKKKSSSQKVKKAKKKKASKKQDDNLAAQ